MFYQKRGLLQIAVTIKNFEYSPLDSELEKQTDISKEQYLGLGKVYEFHKKSDKKFKKVIYDESIYKYLNIF